MGARASHGRLQVKRTSSAGPTRNLHDPGHVILFGDGQGVCDAFLCPRHEGKKADYCKAVGMWMGRYALVRMAKRMEGEGALGHVDGRTRAGHGVDMLGRDLSCARDDWGRGGCSCKYWAL